MATYVENFLYETPTLDFTKIPNRVLRIKCRTKDEYRAKELLSLRYSLPRELKSTSFKSYVLKVLEYSEDAYQRGLAVLQKWGFLKLITVNKLNQRYQYNWYDPEYDEFGQPSPSLLNDSVTTTTESSLNDSVTSRTCDIQVDVCDAKAQDVYDVKSERDSSTTSSKEREASKQENSKLGTQGLETEKSLRDLLDKSPVSNEVPREPDRPSSTCDSGSLVNLSSEVDFFVEDYLETVRPLLGRVRGISTCISDEETEYFHELRSTGTTFETIIATLKEMVQETIDGENTSAKKRLSNQWSLTIQDVLGRSRGGKYSELWKQRQVYESHRTTQTSPKESSWSRAGFMTSL